jgi:hypothetical protein
VSQRLKSFVARAPLILLAAYLGCIAGRAARFGLGYFADFELRELHPFGTITNIALAAVTIYAMPFLIIAVVTSALYLSPRFPLWTWCVPFVAYALVSYSVLVEFRGF